jgi:hypothetical protein
LSSANSTRYHKPPNRPFLLSTIRNILLGLSIIGWVRMAQAIAGWDFQEELLGRPLAIYLVLSGAIWGLCGLVVTVLLLRRSHRAIHAAWIGAIFYPLAFWLERFLLVRSPQDHLNWPFMLGLTLIWLAMVTITLQRRSTRVYLAKEKLSHE